MKDFKLGLYDSKNIFNHLLCLPFSLEERLQPWIYFKKKRILLNRQIFIIRSDKKLSN